VLAKYHTIPVFFRETPNTVFAQGGTAHGNDG